MGMAQHFNPDEYKKNDFGKVGIPFVVIQANADAFSDVFSEGSSALKKLLMHMWENDVETLACCAGHERTPYCYKDTLFGEREIDAEEYNKHKGSSRYHCLSRDKRGFFSFKIDCGGNDDDMRSLKDAFIERLEKAVPPLPAFSVLVRHNNVHNCDEMGFYLDYVPGDRETERFFSFLHMAISDVFCLVTPEQKKVQGAVLVRAAEDLSIALDQPNNLFTSIKDSKKIPDYLLENSKFLKENNLSKEYKVKKISLDAQILSASTRAAGGCAADKAVIKEPVSER